MSSIDNDNSSGANLENAQPEPTIPSEPETNKSGSRTSITKSNSLNRLPPPTLPRPRSHPAPSSSPRSSTSSLSSSSSTSATPTTVYPTSPKSGPKSPGNVFQSSSKASSPVRSTGSIFLSSASSSGSSRTTPTSYKSSATLPSSNLSATSSLTASVEIPSGGPPRPSPPSLGPPAPPLQAPPGPPGPVSRQVGSLSLKACSV